MEFYNTAENAIEFLRNEEKMTCTFSQPRFINRIKQLAEKYPDQVDYTEGTDGVIVAHVPVSYLHIVNYHRELTEEELAVLSERGKRLAEIQRQRRAQAAEQQE